MASKTVENQFFTAPGNISSDGTSGINLADKLLALKSHQAKTSVYRCQSISGASATASTFGASTSAQV